MVALSRIDTIFVRIGAAAFFALALGANAFAFDFSRSLDRGGYIGDYMGRVIADPARRHVISGDCMSACTMWLGHKGTCVTRDAVLWFHAATDAAQAMRNDNPWRNISETGNRAMLGMYPPRVRAVVAPWLESPDYHTLTGTQLAALGVPLCRSV